MKRSGQYTSLASFYDLLNRSVDYKCFAAFLSEAIERCGVRSRGLLLDLACGTGAISFELAKLGYDVIGVDISQDMLAKAYERKLESGSDVLFLCQDMRAFELYGTVESAVCCLDSLNYLLTTADLKKTFALLHNYIEPGGALVFDLNTPYKLKNIFGERDFFFEEEGVFCGWRNYYDDSRKICRFVLDIFAEDGCGGYRRFSEEQEERAYSDTTIKKLLRESGFELLEVCSGFDFEPCSDTDERRFYLCRRDMQPADAALENN